MPASKNPNMMSPLEAASLIGCGQDSVKYWLRTQQFPVGTAVQNQETERWTYLIPRKAFMDWLENYHKTLPVIAFDQWLIQDTYVIPKKELQKNLLGRAEFLRVAEGTP